MGLDIYAISKISSSLEDSLSIRLLSNDIIYNHFSGIQDGDYHYEDKFNFRAGSYGYYNEWRDQLSKMVGYGEAKDHWEWLKVYFSRNEKIVDILDIEEKDILPFSELICFSDCEGFIGTEICRKLHQDFLNHKHLVNQKDEWFLKNYNNFTEAFRYGSNDGCVVFS